MKRKQGCLAGLLELFFLDRVFHWLQRRFGFGRGCSCTGLGCGVMLLILFLAISCQIVTQTNWLRIGF